MDSWKYQPAGDIGMSPIQSFGSLRREAGLASLASQCVWGTLTRAYFQIFHRLKITGRENLPAEPPFVIVANHTSHIDAPALACALPLRLRLRAFPIAAGDTFFTKPVTAWFAAALLNALPMWRKKCGPHALDVLRDRLVSSPAIFILFPEGTRSRDGKSGPFKAGIGRLVAGTNVPVLPCRLSGCFESLPPGSKIPSFARIRVRIGRPRDFSSLPDNRTGWDTIAATLAGDIAEGA
jgi:1-acyl-sn-glycerol-3-phosphate acyltransferase